MTDLHHLVEGAGDETVLLVHGELGSLQDWDATAIALANRYRVVRADLAGHGASPTPATPNDADAHARDLARLLDAFAPGDAHLVAHGAGGSVASALAAARPDRTLSVTLADSFGRVDAALAAKLDSWLAVLDGVGPAIFRRVAAPWVFGAAFLETDPAAVDAWARAGEEADPARERASVELARRQGDRRRNLRAYDAPTMAVVGSHDLLTPMGYSHEIVEWVRHGVMLTLTGGGHRAPFERPDEFNRILAGFLERHRDFAGGPAGWADEEAGEEDDGAEFQDLDELERPGR